MTATTNSSPLVHKGATQLHQFFPRSTQFNFEALRILSTITHGGCDPAEFLTAIAAIKEGDPDSWNEAWKHAAQTAEELVEAALANNDRVAAREALLRAGSYTRAAGYMLINGPTFETHHPQALPTARKVQALFKRVLPLLDCDARFVEIPYEDGQAPRIMLPGYLFLPSPKDRLEDGTLPILINVGGADSSQEEMYFLHPQGGYPRGYAVLSFEGPGQAIVLREHNAHMRPDWEFVTGKVIDWLHTYAKFLEAEEGVQLDFSRLAVAGASMGGYYALRSASDTRIKACIAVDPFYDMYSFGTKHVSGAFMGAWTRGWIGDGVVDMMINASMRYDFKLRWEVGVTRAFWGIDSPALILKHMKNYTLKDGFLRKVQCPTFVTGAGKSLYFDTEEHSQKIFDELSHLGEKRKLWMPNEPDRGSMQAKVGSWDLTNQKVYGFLDEAFGIRRPAFGNKPL